MSNQKDSALTLFDAGFAPFPIAENSKIPLVRWTLDYATEREQVEDWWSNWPNDNIGINCKESALFVGDLDSADAARRYARLWTAMEGEHPNHYGTPIIKTPRGWHYWYDMPDPPLHNTVSLLGEGIDTRGAGGMVLGPGSVIDGVQYRMVSGDLPTTRPRPLPGWLEQRLREFERPAASAPAEPVTPWTEAFARVMLAEVPKRIAVALPGRRNKVLYKASFRLRPALDALGYDRVEDELLAAAGQNGLPEYEARKTIRSALTASAEGR